MRLQSSLNITIEDKGKQLIRVFGEPVLMIALVSTAGKRRDHLTSSIVKKKPATMISIGGLLVLKAGQSALGLTPSPSWATISNPNNSRRRVIS